MQISEIPNANNVKKLKPIKEKQDIYIPDIKDENICRRNGGIYVLAGSGGSGKTSLLLSMMKSKDYYRGKFHNIYYFCPPCSMDSVKNHPFINHDKNYDQLTVQSLEDIYQELADKNVVKKIEKKSKKEKHKGFESEEEVEEQEDEEPEIEYSAIIIDDMADSLKDMNIQKQLSRMMIKARHIKCMFIFTLQSYYYFPKILRKQITYCSIFKPKNTEEWQSISKELLALNKDNGQILYDYLYNEPYVHLDIDTVTNNLYKNFNKLELSNK